MNDQTILYMEEISKHFPGVQALDKVNFELRRGEVHVLVGENGAGKSTLIKILGGIYQPDNGRIFIRDKEVQIHNPDGAHKLGIAIVYQELALVPLLSVEENVYLGREPSFMGFINKKTLYSNISSLLKEIHLNIDQKVRVNSFGIAICQMIEIAKALSSNADILIMDEPTSALNGNEVEELFSLIRRLKANGVSIIYISHRLEEVKKIGDRITILRDGKYITTIDVKEAAIEKLIRLITGRDLKQKFPSRSHKYGSEKLKIESLSRGKVLDNINFSVKAGEVLGIAGLVGSGRTELARTIFGIDQKNKGKIYIEGEEVKIDNPYDAVKLGIGFIPEDRKEQGLILNMSIESNVILPSIDKFIKGGLIDKRKQSNIALQYVSLLNIKISSIIQMVRMLSGGNQQKVVIAKWLCAETRILIFDEPTRGIDVGAKVEVYKIINQLVEEGKAIIIISSELPEILGISDRILVMHQGKITGEFLRDEATQEKIMACAYGRG
jgi:ribose transport system ATP-binding protein